MKRCSKCILPEDYPGVELDENSVCNFCNDYQSFHSKLGKEELIKEIKKLKNGSQYDCIVPISGGKDSTFILYYIVNQLKLTPLAVNFNSGLQNPVAAKNIITACEKLNVKLIMEKSRFSQSLIKQILLIGIKQKSRPYLSRFCRNCETMLRNVSINSAKKFGVNSIIWGSSALESGNNETYLRYKNIDGKIEHERNGIRNVIELARKFLTRKDRFQKLVFRINNRIFGWPVAIKHIPLALKFNILSVIQRFEMKVPLRYALSASKVIPFSQSPKFIHFFDYVEWDSMDNVEILKKELGWNHPEGKEDRFDCLYHGLPNYYAYKVNKITADGVNYCNFIREKKLTREEALNKERTLQNRLFDECREIQNKVGLQKYKLPEIS